MKKAQVAYEFLFVFFVLALAFTVWVVFVSDVQSSFIDQRRTDLANDLVLRIQEEAFIASSIDGDYKRSFDLPYDLHGLKYEIKINSYTIGSSSKERTYGELVWGSSSKVFILPNITGTLVGGENKISSENGYLKFYQ